MDRFTIDLNEDSLEISRFEDELKCNNHFSKFSEIKSSLILGDRDDNNSPLFTIAIPTFKRPELLKEAIFSAVNQRNNDFEILIVDNDADTNPEQSESIKIAKSFNDKRILYYKNEKNIGMFGNWNRCIELARGEWINILSDDDLLSPLFLKEIEPIIAKNRFLGCISVKSCILNEKATTLVKVKNSVFNFLHFFRKILTINHFFAINPTVPSACVFKKDLAIKIGGFSEFFYPDSDHYFFFKLYLFSEIYLLNKKLSYYRIQANESLKIETQKKFIEKAFILRKIMIENKMVPNNSIYHYYFKNYPLLQSYWIIKDFNAKVSLDIKINSVPKNITFFKTILLYFIRIYLVTTCYNKHKINNFLKKINSV